MSPFDSTHIEVYEPPCPLPSWLHRDRYGRIDWKPGCRPAPAKDESGGGAASGSDASPSGPNEQGGRR